MNRIRLLPEQVANQIAAGEVVERPASVAKELIENALDADARQVTVVIKNGGKSLVRVSDDGWGMGRDDALLALERHATSKIATANDLAGIRSLGFRGEAIPSIASVSRFSLVTRERGALGGTKIEINGGKIVSVTETGAAEGTTIEVRNLFFNLPARRKFLRTEPTETAHIEHHVTLGALAQPSVAWRLLVDDRPALQLAPTAELSDRLRELYGAELCGQLVPLHLEQGPVTVRGYIGKAGVSRGDRSQQHIFVNRRPVESRGIGFALGEGYHTALMRGRFPISFLFIEIDPALVDVNVHPAKREIRFRDEFAVRQIVIRAVRQALQLRVDTTEPAVAPLPATVAVSTPTMRPALRLRGEPIPAPVPQQTSLPHVTGQPAGRAAGTSPAAARDECPPAPVLPVAPDQVATETDGAWRIVGVLGHLYVLAESPEGLVLIDQHAAHERVLYERMLRELGSGPAPAQKLLLPLTLQLDPRDAEFLRKNLATLQRLGISVSEFGDKTFLVDALPPYLGVVNLGQAFRDIVDELRRTGEQIHARRLSEDRIATTVCRHAVQARDPLGVEELRGLLEQLHQCDLPYTCPHGRPTMIQVSYEELEKKFGRKV